MKHTDDKLHALLRSWKEIEPRVSFEADVNRRIRLAEAGQSASSGLVEWLQRIMWKPALGIAVAVVASVMLGASAGLLSVPRSNHNAQTELQFMAGGTLSGGYVKLVAGDHR